MNIPLIRKTLKRIEAEYKHFDMGTFQTKITQRFLDAEHYGRLDCGTACCFAGHAVIAKLGMRAFLKLSYHDVPGVAADLLDLTSDQRETLFYLGVNHTQGTKAYVRSAIRQIKAYVKQETGERV